MSLDFLNSIGTNLSLPYGLTVVGNYAYVVSQSNNSLVIFDVSNPSVPSYQGMTSGHLSAPYHVSVYSNYAYVTSYNDSKLVVFDVTDPTNPVYVTEETSDLSRPFYTIILDGYLYVGNNILSGTISIIKYNLATPSSPLPVDWFSGSRTIGMFHDSVYLYVVENASSLLILESSGGSGFTFKSSIPFPVTTNARGVAVYGNYAYITDLSNKVLLVYNVTNRSSPVYVKSVSLGSYNPWYLTISGEYLNIPCENATLIYSVSNPANPVQIASSLSVKGIFGFINGNYCYNTGGNFSVNLLYLSEITDESTSSYSGSQSSLSYPSSESSSTSSADYITFGTTYYNDFRDVYSIPNPIIDNDVRMKFSGFFNSNVKSDVPINNFGYGIKKTKSSNGYVFCDDAAKLFSLSQGSVSMVLSFEEDIINGIHQGLREERDLNEYILWGVNVGKYEVSQPSLYAALTSDGFEFTVWTSAGRYTMINTTLNVDKNDDVLYEFVWDANELDTNLVRVIFMVNHSVVSTANFPITEDTIEGLNFCALNTPFNYSNLECTIRRLVTTNNVPNLELYESSSSSI